MSEGPMSASTSSRSLDSRVVVALSPDTSPYPTNSEALSPSAWSTVVTPPANVANDANDRLYVSAPPTPRYVDFSDMMTTPLSPKSPDSLLTPIPNTMSNSLKTYGRSRTLTTETVYPAPAISRFSTLRSPTRSAEESFSVRHILEDANVSDFSKMSVSDFSKMSSHNERDVDLVIQSPIGLPSAMLRSETV